MRSRSRLTTVFSGRIARRLVLAGVMTFGLSTIAAPQARAQLLLSATFGPPALPVYAQPICPGEGYIWTPGYWAYGSEGYFWVPGTWVLPPRSGFLWTPAWWGWGGNSYIFHAGYWGPHIGFYGGINYGFGYGGVGYEGGYWRGNSFVYNRSVNHIDGSIRNVYERPVPLQNGNYNHVSYNGGNGGVPYRASASEEAALRERHFAPTGEQIQHQSFASRSPQQFASANRGRPPVTAASTPGAFRSSPNSPASNRGVFGPTNAVSRGGFDGASAVRPMAERGANLQQRGYNQQQRIANGFQGGRMTSNEAARAEQRQGAINNSLRNERQANGGFLNQQAVREQNGAGRQIYRENHNSVQQPRMQAAPQMRQSAPQMRQAAPRMQQAAPRGGFGGGGARPPGGGGRPGPR